MFKLFLFCTFFGVLIVFIAGFKQSLTLYSEGKCMSGGNSITLTEKMANLTGRSSWLKIESATVTGWWGIYKTQNYEKQGEVFSGEECYPIGGVYRYSFNEFSLWREYFAHHHPLSLRYLGPPDTETIAITFYAGVNAEGNEHIVRYIEDPKLPFRPSSMFVTGKSKWTLFENINHAGPSICLDSSEKVMFFNEINFEEFGLRSFRSVRQNCESPVSRLIGREPNQSFPDPTTKCKNVESMADSTGSISKASESLQQNSNKSMVSETSELNNFKISFYMSIIISALCVILFVLFVLFWRNGVICQVILKEFSGREIGMEATPVENDVSEEKIV